VHAPVCIRRPSVAHPSPIRCPSAQIDFPLSFRQGITRMTIAPQPTRKTAGSDPAQIEFAMDDFTLVLPYAPKPATAANGTAQVGAKIEKYAGIPFVPDYYAYCDAKAAEARPECLRYRCATRAGRRAASACAPARRACPLCGAQGQPSQHADRSVCCS
jgi:hypothetical protein